MTALSLIDLISFFVYLVLGLMIYFKNPKVPLNRLFALLVGCFSLWSFGEMFVHNPQIPMDTLKFMHNLGAVGWICFPSFSMWFFLLFTRHGDWARKRCLQYLLTFLPLLLLYQQFNGRLLIDYVATALTWSIVWGTTWFYFYCAYFFIVMVSGLALVYRYSKTVKDRFERKQARIIFITGAISLSVGVVMNIIIPVLNIHGIPTLGNLTTMIWVGGIAYSIIRYQLMIVTPAMAAENIISTMTDALILTDSAGYIVGQNRSALTFFGYDEDALYQQPVHMLFDDKARVLIDRIQSRQQITNEEMVMLTSAGNRIPVLLSGSVLTDQRGLIAGMVLITRDISERKKIELKMKQAKEQAEAATNSKSLFLANMSHEIRTPLNGVIGMMELLLGTSLTAEQLEYVKTAKVSGQSLLSVINDILDYSKIEAGKLDIEKVDFDLSTIMENVSDMIAFVAYRKGIELTCLIDPHTPVLLKGDPGRLQQILTNLANNAVKFTNKGDVFLRAEVENESENTVVIRFSVTDTGIGIPEDRLNDLFQSFHQLDSSHTRKYGGTGLGLAISKRLVELMGGQIGAESKKDRGSIFWFRIELEKPAGVDSDKMKKYRFIRKMRLLVVDSNVNSRFALMQVVTAKGGACEEAPNGREALLKLKEAAVKNRPFHIALISKYLPDMESEALGHLIRGESTLTRLKLVLLTPVGIRIDPEQSQKAGFSDFLSKPLKQSQVLDCLAAMTGNGQSQNDMASDREVVVKKGQAVIKTDVRILLAEDNPINQKLALKILENFGYRVGVANNGREAVKALETSDYDCVLMDVQMPEMDGFEATKRIRSGAPGIQNPNLPIIAMTAHAMKGDKEQCFQAGMDDYLSKPIEPDILKAKISRWITSNAN